MTTQEKIKLSALILVCFISFIYLMLFSVKYGYDNIPDVKSTIDTVGCFLTKLPQCK